MNSFLRSHNRSLKAEWLKLKRSGIVWLCIGASLFIPLIGTLVRLFVSNGTDMQEDWNEFLKSNFSGFTGFFFPLFLVITMVRIVYLEHRSDTWKLMETQPVSRLAIFLSKYEIALMIALLSLVGVLVFSLAGGWLLQAGKPGSLQGVPIDWTTLFTVILRFWIASFGMLACIYFISLLIKSFAWPMTIGLVAIIAGSSFAGFQILNWFPFAAAQYTSSSYKGSDTGSFLLPHEKLSILWALLFLAASYSYFRRRSFARAFFAPAGRLVYTIPVLLAFLLIFWWLNKPVMLKPYGKTVLAGMIKTEKPVSRIVVLQAPAYDTVMTGEVKNGRFHLVATEPLEQGTYNLQAGSFNFPIFFGKDDSIFIEINSDKWNTDVKFGGTRLAENEFLKKQTDPFYYLRNYGSNFEPAAYLSQIMEQWESSVKKLENFKTVDNIRPANDFISTQKKLLAVRVLSILDIEYPKTFAVYYPNDVLKYPASINKIRREVRLNEPALLHNNTYIDYVTGYLSSKAERYENKDSALLQMVRDSLSSEPLRDVVIYQQISSKLNYLGDSSRRNQLLGMILPLFKNPSYSTKLLVQSDRLNKLLRGKKAPEIHTETLAGQQLNLSNLLKRYVVIDVWATWCGPCKREAPYFEQLAQQFTSETVAFVSLSIDEDKKAWKREAMGKSRRVLQLWAANASQELAKDYAINSIPRFMLIDPKGNIINARMPSPSDPEFEAILQKEIPSAYR